MSIEDLPDNELNQYEANYRRANKSVGGKYTLSQILLEKAQRKPNVFGVRETAVKILDLTAASKDGLVTYGEISNAFRPNSPWEGNNTQKIVADALGRVVHYCVTNELPILTVLVVRGSTRALAKEAIANICNECRELGMMLDMIPMISLGDKLTRLAL